MFLNSTFSAKLISKRIKYQKRLLPLYFEKSNWTNEMIQTDTICIFIISKVDAKDDSNFKRTTILKLQANLSNYLNSAPFLNKEEQLTTYTRFAISISSLV